MQNSSLEVPFTTLVTASTASRKFYSSDELYVQSTASAQWAAASGVAANATAYAADTDGDGMSNLLELALNTNPTDPTSTGNLKPTTVLGVSHGIQPNAPELRYEWQCSNDLNTWESVGYLQGDANPVVFSPGWTAQRSVDVSGKHSATWTAPASASRKCF